MDSKEDFRRKLAAAIGVPVSLVQDVADALHSVAQDAEAGAMAMMPPRGPTPAELEAYAEGTFVHSVHVAKEPIE